MSDPALGRLRRLLGHGRFELRRRLRRPAPGRFQPYAHTGPDRYPWLFSFAQGQLAQRPDCRVLSFGCSRGDEAFSLRRYLPAAEVKGVDFDPANVAAAIGRARLEGVQRVAFAAGADTRSEPSEHYDAIFCLAVLCHGDLTVTRARHSEPLMRFEDFERTVADFARCLKPGGLLFLHTTNFRFGDTAAAEAFETVLEARPEQLAPDLLFDRDGRLLPGERYLPVGFRKRTGPA